MIGALKDWLHPPCCSLALAALLLSACSSSSSCASPQDQMQLQLHMLPDAECDTLRLSHSRDPFRENYHVNILLLTGGHDTLGSSLRAIAQALCMHVTDGSLRGSNLLPTVLDYPGVAPLASVGQLAQANSGVCLLTQPLSNKQGRAVGEALRAGHATAPLASGQTCSVDIHPTVWCLSAAPDLLPKQQPQQSDKKINKFASSKNVAAPLAVLFAEKSSPQLAAQFDVILDCSSIEDDVAEAWADDYLATLVCGEVEEKQAEKRDAARRALQSHITTCQQLTQPTMTPSAMGLLKSYWTAARAAANSGSSGSGMVSSTSLETAAKLAAASARLFHRTEIHPFPDVTLAVALCEEGLIARGWNSELWGSMREQMAYGRDLEECLTELYRRLVQISKQFGWEWAAQEE